MDDRTQARLVSLGELCLHDTDRCFDCLNLRYERAMAVIALQSNVIGVVRSEWAYALAPGER